MSLGNTIIAPMLAALAAPACAAPAWLARQRPRLDRDDFDDEPLP